MKRKIKRIIALLILLLIFSANIEAEFEYQQRLDDLANEHHIRIIHGAFIPSEYIEQRYSFEYGYHSQNQERLALISQHLEAVLEKYPRRFLSRGNFQGIVLVQNLAKENGRNQNFAIDREKNYLYIDLDLGNPDLSESFVSTITHHQLFTTIVYANYQRYNLGEWNRLNIAGFNYGDSYPGAGKGFIDWPSAMRFEDDMADVFVHLIIADKYEEIRETLASDQILLNKFAYLNNFITSIDSRFETTFASEYRLVQEEREIVEDSTIGEVDDTRREVVEVEAYNPELSNWLEFRLAERGNTLSLGAVIVSSKGIHHIGAAGLRSAGESYQVEYDDPWHLGSLTKAMTATLAGRYVDKGVISFDSSINQVLGNSISEINPSYRNVTLRNLLSNHGGVPRDVRRMSYDSNLSTKENRHIWVEETLKEAPSYTPGREYNYSNAGFIIAGRMLEEVGGDSWENLMREELFRPLGMNNSGFGPPGSADEIDAPRGHRFSDGEFRPQFRDSPPALGPAGTVYTTLEDYGRFLVDQMRGAMGNDGILRAETYREIFTNYGSNYGLGWGVGIYGQSVSFGHTGSNNMWYATSQGSTQDDLAILVVTNSANSEAQSTVREIKRMLDDRIY